MTKKERTLLQHAMQVLGPEATSCCQGCNYEVGEALRCLREVGIEYQPRKKRTGPKHDKAAERRANDPSLMLVPVPVRRRRNRLEVDVDRMDDAVGYEGLRVLARYFAGLR